MSAPVWDTRLPRWFVRNNFNAQFPDGRGISEPDNGLFRTERRYSNAIMPARGLLPCTAFQYDVLMQFWMVTTSGGSRAFWFPDQLHDGLPMLNEAGVPVLGEDDRPIIVSASWLVKFGKTPPSVTIPAGSLRDVPIELWVLP
ncbi:MAG TPA: hypothetical protein VLA00_14545 [Xanthobacteraceae bacterium]|nr:hypothetical protein [Xanthobacteraceae bacterium]